jgi:NodT family efflux transporter outer membrane factor (OMF) lipoprotein
MKVTLWLTTVPLIAAGCASVGPDYVRPELATPASWHEPLSQGITVAPVDPQALARWWSVLDDPTLTALEERAVNGNLDLAQAKQRIMQASAQREVARAAFYPTMRGGVAYVSSLESLNTNTAGTNPTSGIQAGLDVRWEIDLFGGIRRGVEAATGEFEASQAEYDGVLVSLAAGVAQKYVEVRALQARLAVLNKNVANQTELLQLARWRTQAGLATSLDSEQARANLEQTRAQLPALQAGLETARNHLAVLVGEPPGALAELLDAPQPVPVPPANIAVGVPADVLRQRPDVRRAERQLAAETARIGVQKAAEYPTLTLSTNVATLSQLFFDDGAVREKVKAQDAVREGAIAKYKSTVLTALEEVENALVSFSQEQDRHTSLASAAQVAADAAKLAQDQYSSGLSGFDVVLNAQRSLFTLQDQLAVSDGQITTYLIALYKSLGGGWVRRSDG